MENLKIFFYHLHFSIVSGGIGTVVICAILVVSGRESTISNHLWSVGMTCWALCSCLAVLFTYRTMQSRVRRTMSVRSVSSETIMADASEPREL
jgi:hypothetical protein